MRFLRRRLLGLWVLGLGVSSCADDGLGLSVDLRTDWQPGRQFVGVITTLGHGLAEDFEAAGVPQQVVAIPSQDYVGGNRVAELDGLEAGEITVRVELLTAEGALLTSRDTLVDLRQSFALTVLLASSCADVSCPREGDSPELTACNGGQCVDPRCSPDHPHFCGEQLCEDDGDCVAGGECTAGACIEGVCLLRAEDEACMPGYVCDLREGCTLAAGVDGGPGCPATETSCLDGLDDDCDGQVDCADTDCAEQPCDDESVCTTDDVCAAGACQGTGVSCDDGNECTDDVCDPLAGCSSSPNTVPCDDGTWCNGADSCRNGLCQDHRDPPCAQFCNESTMACDMCAADSDCGAVSYGGWSACGGFSSTCDETATQSRSVMTPRCRSGACEVDVTSQSRSCSRSRTGVSCGTTTYGSWSGCGGYANACDATGTQSRSVTTRTCGSGSCQSNTSSQSRGCSRTVANGKSCGTNRVCCSNSCVSITSSSHCGACGVSCSAVGLSCASTGSGGYSCRGCTANSQCQSELSSAATCWDTGAPPAFCQCQCASNGVCANGGCGSGFYCHDEPGHNYCSPSP